MGQEGARTGIAFRLVGREQFEDEATWHTDWHVARRDGRVSQLSETDGGYVWFDYLGVQAGHLPLEGWVLGEAIEVNGSEFKATAIRHCTQGGAEGEVGHALLPGELFGLVELRSRQGRALRIDYASGQPSLWIGERLSLNKLGLTGTTLSEKPEDGFERLSCPSCGGRVDLLTEGALSASCPACGSLLDLSDISQLSGALGASLTGYHSSIPLGAAGWLLGTTWQVVGYEKRRADLKDKTFAWQQYQLYNREAGFARLIELQGRWRLLRRTSGVPALSPTKGAANYRNIEYFRAQEFDATTFRATGEFSFRVRLGRTTGFVEYQNRVESGHIRYLCLEQDGREGYWQEGWSISFEELAAAFPSVRSRVFDDDMDWLWLHRKLLGAAGVLSGRSWTVVGFQQWAPDEEGAEGGVTLYQLKDGTGRYGFLTHASAGWRLLQPLTSAPPVVSSSSGGGVTLRGEKYPFEEELKAVLLYSEGEIEHSFEPGVRADFREAWQARSEDLPAFLWTIASANISLPWWGGVCLSEKEVSAAFGTGVSQRARPSPDAIEKQVRPASKPQPTLHDLMDYLESLDSPMGRVGKYVFWAAVMCVGVWLASAWF